MTLEELLMVIDLHDAIAIEFDEDIVYKGINDNYNSSKYLNNTVKHVSTYNDIDYGIIIEIVIE